MPLTEVIKQKYGSQAKCAKKMNWTRQKLNKIINKQREARVSEINELASALELPVSDIVLFLTN